MSSHDKKRTYKAIDPDKSYPSGAHAFYQCELCGDVVPSSPKASVHCRCRNIRIDADAGRIAIRDHAHAKFFYEEDA